MEKIFITGEKRVGKSSLVKKQIEPYREVISGFFTQRIFGEFDNSCDFRMIDFSSEEAYCLEIHGAAEGIIRPDVFMKFDDKSKINKNINVFNTTGYEILKASLLNKKAMIVIDEIGQLELEALEYMKVFYEVLNSDIPLIGVLKKENTRIMDFISNMKEAEIIELNSDNYSRVEERVFEYLSMANSLSAK